MMATVAARELADGEVVFVGIGVPNLACNLARVTHAPNLVLIYESGAVGAVPERLPVSIGDPALVTGSLMVCGMADVFQLILQNGRIDVGFLGGAQVDRYGNINTTVIGPYERPRVRLPGSGGAAEIAIHARRTVVVSKLSPRAFPEQVDFVTSPGHRSGGVRRDELGMPGAGPVRVITDKAILAADAVAGELILSALYPRATAAGVQASVGGPPAPGRHRDHAGRARGLGGDATVPVRALEREPHERRLDSDSHVARGGAARGHGRGPEPGARPLAGHPPLHRDRDRESTRGAAGRLHGAPGERADRADPARLPACDAARGVAAVRSRTTRLDAGLSQGIGAGDRARGRPGDAPLP